MRIISLIPAATEIISSLGLMGKLVGVSHECDFPKEVFRLPKLTKSNIKQTQNSYDIHKDIEKILSAGLSVYEVDTELLKTLKPNIIITQTQCNVCAVGLDDIKSCLNSWLTTEITLIDLKSFSFNGIMNEILEIEKNLNKINRARKVVKEINQEISYIKEKLNNEKKKNVLCIEWLNPLMTSGNWIPDLLTYSKALDSHGASNKRSHILDEKKIKLHDVESIIFMPCGFDIDRTEAELKKFSFSL
ncbi:MAG: hypothetical protein CFH30_00399, partial [Alphaproteobacteria bacterium MarineAlpha8_Bin1]